MRANKQNILKYLQEIKSDLVKNGIFELALFGGFSRDDENIYSDINIAIKKENDYLIKRTSYEYFEEVNRIKSLVKREFHRNIDIFDLDSNSQMKSSIMKDLIYV